MTGPIKKEALTSNALNAFYGPSNADEPIISSNDLIDNDFILHSANLNFQNKKNRFYNLSKPFYGITLGESFETSKEKNILNGNHLANLTYYDSDKISQAVYVKIPFIHNLPDPEDFSNEAMKKMVRESHSLCFLDPTIMDQTTVIPENTIVKVVFTDQNFKFGYIVNDPILYRQSLMFAPREEGSDGIEPEDTAEPDVTTAATGGPSITIPDIDMPEITAKSIHSTRFTHRQNPLPKIGIVIHTTECCGASTFQNDRSRDKDPNVRNPNRTNQGGAEQLAVWWNRPGTEDDKASAHYCIDDQKIVQMVKEEDEAHQVRDSGCYFNRSTIGIELVATAYYNEETWSNEYSRKQLALLAKLIARICKKHEIPIVKAYPVEGQWTGYTYSDSKGEGWMKEPEYCKKPETFTKGIYTHYQVSYAFKIEGGHWDPGPHFPINSLLQKAQEEFATLP